MTHHTVIHHTVIQPSNADPAATAKSDAPQMTELNAALAHCETLLGESPELDDLSDWADRVKAAFQRLEKLVLLRHAGVHDRLFGEIDKLDESQRDAIRQLESGNKHVAKRLDIIKTHAIVLGLPKGEPETNNVEQQIMDLTDRGAELIDAVKQQEEAIAGWFADAKSQGVSGPVQESGQSQPEPPFPPQPLSQPGLESRMRPRPKYQAADYRPAGKLDGKVALITGGDSGIGRAVALLFAREGADVALVYLAEEQTDAERIKADIEDENRQALLIPGDVRDADFCRKAVQRTVAEYGKLDVLVNNAAYQKHRDGLDELSLEQWERTFRTNIFGYFYMAKFAVPHMSPGGSIINTGSITGMEGSKGLLDYASTKGAIHAFTKSLAQQLLDQGIRVNCVAPGPVWTPLNPAERPAEEIEDFGADTPMGRPAQPEEIAPTFVFLASSADSSYISGHVLPLLGGDTIAG